jgi:hypothetical protein
MGPLRRPPSVRPVNNDEAEPEPTVFASAIKRFEPWKLAGGVIIACVVAGVSGYAYLQRYATQEDVEARFISHAGAQHEVSRARIDALESRTMRLEAQFQIIYDGLQRIGAAVGTQLRPMPPPAAPPP